jgi:hypothetical protein
MLRKNGTPADLLSGLLGAEGIARSMTACAIREPLSQIGSAIPLGALGRIGLVPRTPKKQNLPSLLESSYVERDID